MTFFLNIFIIFSQKVGFDISCKLCPKKQSAGSTMVPIQKTFQHFIRYFNGLVQTLGCGNELNAEYLINVLLLLCGLDTCLLIITRAES